MGRGYKTRTMEEAMELVPMCPRCRANIHWSLRNGTPGAQGYASCGNGPSATRILFDPTNMIICNWKGIVVRNKNGAVDIFNEDGTMVPHRVVKYDQTRRF